jgi:hypothetical protein
MPGGDGTGPLGWGPMMGRAAAMIAMSRQKAGIHAKEAIS